MKQQGHPRDRRRDHRPARAEVGQRRQRDGQDLPRSRWSACSTASRCRPCAPGNTCYSWVSDREAIAVVNAYKIENGKVVQIEQKLTPAQSALGGPARRAAGARASGRDILGMSAVTPGHATDHASRAALVAGSLGLALAPAPARARGPARRPGRRQGRSPARPATAPAGNSRSNTMPIIAGMDPAYFKKQIEDYAAGKRPSPEMEPYAKQVAEPRAWTRSRPTSPPQKREPTPIRVAGRRRWRAGAARRPSARSVTARRGKGDPARKLIPSLAGQAARLPRASRCCCSSRTRGIPGDADARRGEGADEDDPGRAARRPGRVLLEPPLAALERRRRASGR